VIESFDLQDFIAQQPFLAEYRKWLYETKGIFDLVEIQLQQEMVLDPKDIIVLLELLHQFHDKQENIAQIPE